MVKIALDGNKIVFWGEKGGPVPKIIQIHKSIYRCMPYIESCILGQQNDLRGLKYPRLLEN